MRRDRLSKYGLEQQNPLGLGLTAFYFRNDDGDEDLLTVTVYEDDTGFNIYDEEFNVILEGPFKDSRVANARAYIHMRQFAGNFCESGFLDRTRYGEAFAYGPN